MYDKKRRDSVRYQAVLFDVGDTLVNYWPNYAQMYSDRLRTLGFAVEGDLPSVVSRAIYRAGGEQTRKEQAGAPRMDDRAFSACWTRRHWIA